MKSESTIDGQLASVGICKAFEELTATLPSASSAGPLVILAFDEARTLASPGNDKPWFHFTELRRVLRVLKDQPLFSLFLTTTGNVDALVPSSRKNFSSRVKNQVLSSSRPFAEVGFDHFAFKDQFDFEKVTGIEHITHFGRPLCVS